MIKGLAITPPILGRISIGRVVEKNGKRVPEKDDQFTITSQMQNREGWVNHPLDETFRQQSANHKIRSIPVKVIFNDPALSLRAEYSLFDRQTGRPLCTGNGETCQRHTSKGVETFDCPTPDHCEFGQVAGCKLYGRLYVHIGDEDELGCFILRTTGYNSVRVLAARLHYLQAVSGNLLACLPMELRLRGKSTTMSYRSAIYYVDITIRDGMTLEEAIIQARETNERRTAIGYDQTALDNAASIGFNCGTFEESEEEMQAVLDEFFPLPEDQPMPGGSSTSVKTPVSLSVLSSSTTKDEPNADSSSQEITQKQSTLMRKLDNKALALQPPAPAIITGVTVSTATATKPGRLLTPTPASKQVSKQISRTRNT